MWPAADDDQVPGGPCRSRPARRDEKGPAVSLGVPTPMGVPPVRCERCGGVHPTSAPEDLSSQVPSISVT